MSPHPACRPSPWAAPLIAAALLAGTGCAGDYISRTQGIRQAYESGSYARAAEEIQGEVKGGSEVDKLLALMDEGMILHAAGRYDESIPVLARASKLSEQLDVVSVSEEAKVLLTSEREKAYRGEDFEKLMIDVLQALNYAQRGDDEGALVEVRRVNDRMLKMIRDEGKPYEQLAIARYLSGVLWEDGGSLDDAFIDYDAANSLAGEMGSLAEPLLRLARETGRDEALQRLRKQYPGLEAGRLAAGEGQLLVLMEAGRVPEKTNGTWDGRVKAEVIAVPVFRDRPWNRVAAVSVDGGPRQSPTSLTSLEQISQIHLHDRIGRMIAKQLAGTALKAGVATGVGVATKSEALGVLTFLALSFVNQTDLRSWLSLPAEFQLVRYRLPSGSHEVTVERAGQPRTVKVEIKPKRVTLVVLRQY